MVIDADEAALDLPTLIEHLERGAEEVVIHRDGVPVARLVPCPAAAAPRRLGGWGPVELTAEDDADYFSTGEW